MPVLSPVTETEIRRARLTISRMGLVEYSKALEIQRSIHRDVVKGMNSQSLLLLEHPSVYTAGKRTSLVEKPTDGTPVIDVDRGGKITWHGPGQLIGYPIVTLAKPKELVGFVREIESGLINVCADLGINSGRIEGRSGVWVRDEQGERKIAAIGIRVAQGVSMHGFALNVNPDLSPFKKIIPCGISDAEVTSLAVELRREISIDEVIPVVEKHLFESLMKVSA
jgi:lipoyl(octanoyl) transferase